MEEYKTLGSPLGENQGRNTKSPNFEGFFNENIHIKTEEEHNSSLEIESDSKLVKSENLDNETTHYKCGICSKDFKIFGDYRVHRKQHFVEKRTCKVCQIVCQSISKLEIHMNSHLGLKPYKCTICDKNFVSDNQLKLHGRCHSDEKRYSCKKCSKAFRHLGSLRSHMVIHNNIKEFQCKVRPQRAPNKGYLSDVTQSRPISNRDSVSV